MEIDNTGSNSHLVYAVIISIPTAYRSLLRSSVCSELVIDRHSSATRKHLTALHVTECKTPYCNVKLLGMLWKTRSKRRRSFSGPQWKPRLSTAIDSVWLSSILSLYFAVSAPLTTYYAHDNCPKPFTKCDTGVQRDQTKVIFIAWT